MAVSASGSRWRRGRPTTGAARLRASSGEPEFRFGTRPAGFYEHATGQVRPIPPARGPSYRAVPHESQAPHDQPGREPPGREPHRDTSAAPPRAVNHENPPPREMAPAHRRRTWRPRLTERRRGESSSHFARAPARWLIDHRAGPGARALPSCRLQSPMRAEVGRVPTKCHRFVGGPRPVPP